MNENMNGQPPKEKQYLVGEGFIRAVQQMAQSNTRTASVASDIVSVCLTIKPIEAPPDEPKA